MRLIFAGTPEFAQQALSALHAAGHTVTLVLTQPDRPAGRGLKLQPSPVKQWALAHKLAVAQPRSLRLDGKYPEDALHAQALIAQTQADAMVVAAYGLILPLWVLHSVPLGCLNIHASLLPRWRGAAPIHRAIEAGDAQTGVCIMQMDEGLDTGGVRLRAAVPIDTCDTTAVLHDRLATLGAQLMVQVLADLSAHPSTAQPLDGVTYAHKVDKHEAALDWHLSAGQLAQRVRAFDPFPGAQTTLGSELIKVWAALPLHDLPHSLSSATTSPTGTGPDVAADPAWDTATGTVGQVLAVSDQGVDVACGQGVLRLTQLQRAGGKRLAVADFLRGHRIAPGQHMAVLPPSTSTTLGPGTGT